MKRLIMYSILIFCLILPVSAKDTVYSIHKYQEEKFTHLEKSIKEDGFIVAGNYLKETLKQEEESYQNYQVLVAKYLKNGTLSWTYSYGKTKEDQVDFLSYTYDSEGDKSGYLVGTTKSYDVLTEEMGDSYTVLLYIDEEGRLISEKEIEEGIIKKLIPTTNENNQVDGYISILNTETGSCLVKWNLDFTIQWRKDYSEVELKDCCFVKEENKIISYILLENNNIIQVDEFGNNEVILEHLEENPTVYLKGIEDGFLLYGTTTNVKFKNGDTSYFLMKYNKEGLVWETIGNVPVNPKQNILLEESEKGYLIFYKNNKDSSYEVMTLDQEGVLGKKVKKIINDYYNFHKFIQEDNVLYFVGQISCLEEDDCEIEENSLFLISTEDKVIEVEDKDSTGILIGFGILILLLGGTIYYKRKKRLTK